MTGVFTMSEWRFVIEHPPVGTPRPRVRRTEDGKTITYYDQWYYDYMDNVQRDLKSAGALNDLFYSVMSAELGVKAKIVFYVQAPKSQKRIKNIMRTTAPDIDNLVKACLDSIFKDLKIKDSRIVMLTTAKFQELENPRTEVVLEGIE